MLSDDFVWEESGVLRVVGGEETIIRTFPKLSKDVLPADFKEIAARVILQFIREARIMRMHRQAFILYSQLRHQRSFLASL